MSTILTYHRPSSLDEAAQLLSEPNRSILAGGTAVVPDARSGQLNDVELVDLQSLDLANIEADGDRLRVGAMVRLSDFSAHDGVGDLLSDLARRELPSAMRNQATIGGTIAAAEANSVLVAGLLVHDTQVEFHDGSSRPLGQVLADGTNGAIIVAASIDPTGTGTIMATGRTPADEPIVAAVARSTADGVRLALTGVASTVIEVDPADPVSGLEPPSDFRGSSEYRLELSKILADRATKEVA